MQEGFVERGGVRLHYLEWAPSAPVPREPILFLHGLSSNARFWERLAERLPERRLIALDQRSHGMSDRPAAGYSHETLVADAAHVVESLRLGRAVVAGHSWGAAIALELAVARPDLISGLAFIDGPASSMSEVLSWEQAQQMMQPPLPRYRNQEEAIAATKNTLGASWAEDLIPFVEAGLVKDGSDYVLTLTHEIRHQILKEMFHYHPELLWPAVEGPISVLMAESETPFGQWKRRSEALITAARPDASVRWYRAAHDIPIHLPNEVAEELERLSLRAGFADIMLRAGSLAGDWRRGTAAEEWSAHDLLAHVASTQAALAAVAASAAQHDGQPAGEPFDPDRWNAKQVLRRRERQVEDLLQEVGEGTARLDGILRGADLARPVAIGPYAGLPLDEAMREMLAHQRGHLSELQSALAKA